MYVHPNFVTGDKCQRLCAAIARRETSPALVYSREAHAGIEDDGSRKTVKVSGKEDEFEWLASDSRIFGPISLTILTGHSNGSSGLIF